MLQDEEDDEDDEDDENEAFEGPMTWEDVDKTESEGVMLRVINAAMPISENKDLATRYAAHQTHNPCGTHLLFAVSTIIEAGG